MSNAIAQFKVGFEPKFQDILHKALIGKRLAAYGLKKELTWGQSVDRPIFSISGLIVRDVTRYTDRTMNDLTTTKETMTIDRQKAVDFALDDWDKLQNGPLKVGEVAGRESAIKLAEYVDGDILYETVNGFDVVDYGDLSGGSAGTAITLTTTNAVEVMAAVQARLQANNVKGAGMTWVMDPYQLAIYTQTVIGKNIDLAGYALKNGYSGPLVGFETALSNGLTYTNVLGLATEPTANDTVVVAGVTFTFVASPSAAGDVDLGGSADATRANLAAAINGGAGAGTAYVAISAANRIIYTNLRISAVNSDSANTLTLTAKGSGRQVVSETLTAAGDVWTGGRLHSFAGQRGSIDVVMQQDIMPDIRKEPKQKTSNVLTDALYTVKTFADGAQKFVDVQFVV